MWEEVRSGTAGPLGCAQLAGDRGHPCLLPEPTSPHHPGQTSPRGRCPQGRPLDLTHDACYWLSPPSTLRTGRRVVPGPAGHLLSGPPGTASPGIRDLPASSRPQDGSPLVTPPLGSEQQPWDPGTGGRVGGAWGQRPWWNREAWPGPNWAERGIWGRAGVGSSLLALLIRASLGSVPSGGARRGSVLKSEGWRDRDARARGWGPVLRAPATL